MADTVPEPFQSRAIETIEGLGLDPTPKLVALWMCAWTEGYTEGSSDAAKFEEAMREGRGRTRRG